MTLLERKKKKVEVGLLKETHQVTVMFSYVAALRLLENSKQCKYLAK